MSFQSVKVFLLNMELHPCSSLCGRRERQLFGMLFPSMFIMLYPILLTLTPTLRQRIRACFVNFHKRSFQNPKVRAFELLILSALA